MIALTHFPKLRDAQGARYRTTWEKLIGRLSVARVVENKHDAPGFSLATYAGDRRASANVERVYAVGLDLDHLDALSIKMKRTPGLIVDAIDWDALTVLFAATESFLHTTWSSTESATRARVFMRLSRPVTGDEYRRVYAACAAKAESAGLVVDRQASDPSRLWFLPAISPGSTFRFSIGRGKPVHVESALEAFPEPVPPSTPPPSSTRPRVAAATNVEERAAKYVDACDPAISGQEGHKATFKLAMRLVQGFALDEETAYRLMLPWNARCSPPWREWELRRKIRQAGERGRMPEGALRDAPRRAS